MTFGKESDIMRKRSLISRIGSMLMAFFLIFTYSGVAAFAGTEGFDTERYGVADKSGEGSKRPDQLAEGQIWTGKTVDIGAFSSLTFEITLYAWGAQFTGKEGNLSDPLTGGVTVTDVIDGNFEIIYAPASLSITGNTVIWTVSQNEILKEGGASVSYTIRLAEGWQPDVLYEFGGAGSTTAVFEPVEDNPYYYREKEVV